MEILRWKFFYELHYNFTTYTCFLTSRYRKFNFLKGVGLNVSNLNITECVWKGAFIYDEKEIQVHFT